MSTTLERPRASAVLDCPPGLTKAESRAYVVGYAAACVRYAKKYGIPSVTPADVAVRIRGGEPTLHELTVEYEWARHPVAHRAGLLAIKKHRVAEGERLRVSGLVLPLVGAA